jgi:hypothetical protein
MKLILSLIKLATLSIVVLVLSIIFMFATISYLPRLNGVNYYDHGCFDGVTNLRMQFLYNNVDKKEYIKYEEQARKDCELNVKKLKEKGYLL